MGGLRINKEYGNYLVGLGMGLILGGLSAAKSYDQFPKLLWAFGLCSVILGLVIYFYAGRKELGKKG